MSAWRVCTDGRCRNAPNGETLSAAARKLYDVLDAVMRELIPGLCLPEGLEDAAHAALAGARGEGQPKPAYSVADAMIMAGKK